MVGAAGRKGIDSSGHSPVSRLSWTVDSENQTGKLLTDACWGRCQLFTAVETVPPGPRRSTASGYWRLSSSGTQPTWWGCPQEGVFPLLGTTISVVTTQKASTGGCASRQTIPAIKFPAILAEVVVAASRNPMLKSTTKRDTAHTFGLASTGSKCACGAITLKSVHVFLGNAFSKSWLQLLVILSQLRIVPLQAAQNANDLKIH